MTIGTRRDNIARALRCLGYDYAYHDNDPYIVMARHNHLTGHDITIWIGRNGKVEILRYDFYTQKSYHLKLNSAAKAALISAGEYIFLCGSISSSEKKRIANLVP